MSTGRAGGGEIRYQPDEAPAPGLALGLGLQICVLTIAAIILIPTIVMRAGARARAICPGQCSRRS